MVVLDSQGRVVRFNRACEELTGYAFGEVKGRHPWDLFVAAEDVEAARSAFEELRPGRGPQEHESQWLDQDGRRRLILWSNTLLLDQDGHVEHVIGTGTDVTIQRMAEEACGKVRGSTTS